MESPEAKTATTTTIKYVVSCALILYLFVLVLGPLSNPVGSDYLTRPLAKTVRPIHRVLFLGHGYRFFAPDPGPSHLVEYEIKGKDGELTRGVFPSRDDDNHAFPRLLYHRWFMLSESIWSEHSMTPLDADFRAQQDRLENLANEKKIAGHHKIASRIRADRDEQKRSYLAARKRIDELVQSVARNLLEMHGGTNIRLMVREREIPFPFEIEEGTKLDNPRFLKPNPPPVIGEFTAMELGLEGESE